MLNLYFQIESQVVFTLMCVSIGTYNQSEVQNAYTKY